MTPESVLAALVTHSQDMDLGRPDPLILEASRERVGKAHPEKWKLVFSSDGDRVEIWTASRSALGKQSFRPSRFSVPEVAADALIGMYDRNWEALQCALAIGVGVRTKVRRRLMRVAYRIKKSERVWRDGIQRQPCRCGRQASIDYVPDLVELAMLHLEDPYLFGTHRARFEWFGLGESAWHDVMAHPFDQVAAHLWSWYHQGIGHIQHRIVCRGERLE